jgi:hypothetical protein
MISTTGKRKRTRDESHRKRYTSLTPLDVKYMKDISEVQLGVIKKDMLTPANKRM